MNSIYFDHASTTPVEPQVASAMAPYLTDHFANALSPYRMGQEAHKALEDAREQIAQFIGADSKEIIFNSGATEGNNHAIFGAVRALKEKGKHIIVSAIEHHSVLEPIEYLKNEEGYEVTYIGVDSDGIVNPNDVESAITDATVLIAVMMANNEIGTIQPVNEIGEMARRNNIIFLVDAVQAVGHIPLHVDDIHADLMTLSAHKFYGPKGVGALFKRSEIDLPAYLLGGSQEGGRRASTQNVAGVVGMAKAIELCAATLDTEAKAQTKLRDKLLTAIPEAISGTKVNGSVSKRLPNNAHFSFDGIQGESLLMSLDMANIAASMGSACAAGAMEPSHVLRALGLTDELAYGALRISLGRHTTDEHVDYLLEKLPPIVESLRI